MSKQSQKAAVYAAITSVCASNGIKFEDGMSVASVLTKEHRAQVTNILVEGFNSGSIELEKTYETPEALRSYVTGLISNWVRKDDRLNGGVKYQPKNPGTRTGSGDAQVKALKALLMQVSTVEEKQEIQAHIDMRLAEIAKAKAPAVDFSVLPEALRSKYSA